MEFSDLFNGSGGVFMAVFLLVVGIVTILLPFYVIAIHSEVRRTRKAAEESRSYLKTLADWQEFNNRLRLKREERENERKLEE